MTEDDIMLIVQKAGPLTQGPFEEWCKRFADLVAAHEREAIAKLADQSWLTLASMPTSIRHSQCLPKLSE